jgi:hypothetical protein
MRLDFATHKYMEKKNRRVCVFINIVIGTAVPITKLPVFAWGEG